MSAEILELLTRIAELERKLDSLFRHGPVHERKKIDGRWFVRLKIGGADQEPFLSPWVPYSSANGGPQSPTCIVNCARNRHQRRRDKFEGHASKVKPTGGVRPNASENGQIRPPNTAWVASWPFFESGVPGNSRKSLQFALGYNFC